MQYTVGLVSATNGSAVITNNDAVNCQWLTEIAVGYVFKFQVASDPTYVVASVDSDTQITLSANYVGDRANQAYVIQRDFSANRGYALPNQGEWQIMDILREKTINKIDADIHLLFLKQNMMINAGEHGIVGNGTADEIDAIETAIAVAQALVAGTFNRSVITVYIGDGDYSISRQLAIPPNINLHCDGIIYNNLADKWEPAVHIQAGGHCSKVQVYGNLGSGVMFGEETLSANMQIGDVRLWNIGEEYDAGKGSKTGVRFAGYNFTFDSIDCDGGNVGVDVNLASDVRGNKVLSFTASTGLRITSASEHIYIGYVDIDTPGYKGVQIDSSHNISLPNCSIFLNDNEWQSDLADAVVIGEYSASDKVNNLNATFRVQNTGGQALKLYNIRESDVKLIATNATLATGNSHPLTSGIEYAAGVESSVRVTGAIDGSIPISVIGTVVGDLHLAGNRYEINEVANFNAEIIVKDRMRTDNITTAGATRLQIYDVDTGQLQRVHVGANDSEGSGYRALRVPNS